MKVVLDMNMSTQLAAWLCGRGMDALHWHQLGAGDAADEDILAWCRSHAACLVSQDADFARLLFQSQASQPSVIHVRDCDPVALLTWERILALLRGQSKNIEAGCLFVLTPRQVRLRRLPIRPGYDPAEALVFGAPPGD